MPNNPNQCDWCSRLINSTRTRCTCNCTFHGFIDPETAARLAASGLSTRVQYCCLVCCREQRHVTMACGHCSATPCEHVVVCESCGSRTDTAPGWNSGAARDRGLQWREPCTCCSDANLCTACCRHRCCVGDNGTAVRMVGHRLAFWVPTRDKQYQKYKTYAALSAEDAAGVLGKQLGYRFVDPRGFKINDSRRFASVEIEVDTYAALDPVSRRVLGEGFKPLNQTISRWQACVVRDGSVGGFEINSAPACGDALPDQINEICNSLALVHAGVAENCGLHVHVDCRDFGYQEIRRLVNLYVEFEETMFAAVHRSRYDNRYSRHCAQQYLERMILGVKPEKKLIKHAIIEQTYGRGSANGRAGIVPLFHQTRSQHYGGGAGSPRYNALNIHSFFMRGTIESRLHHGSILPEEIYSWARIWIEILDAVGKLSDSKADAITRVSSTDHDLMTDYLGLNSKKYTRPDVRRPVVATGAVVLSRLLSPRMMDEMVERIRYFGPSRAKIPSMKGQSEEAPAPVAASAPPEGSAQANEEYLRQLTDVQFRTRGRDRNHPPSISRYAPGGPAVAPAGMETVDATTVERERTIAALDGFDPATWTLYTSNTQPTPDSDFIDPHEPGS